jgi:hypothetical protein
MTGIPAPRGGLLPGAPGGTQLAPDAPAAPAPTPGPGGRRPRAPLLVMIGAAVLVLAAVGAFLLVSKGAGDEVAGGAAAATGPVRSTVSATPSGTATTSASATVPAVVAVGRNPFLQPEGAAATGSPGSSGMSGSLDPGSSAGTSASPSTSASAGTSASPPASSGTTGSTGITGPIYVGLYAFSGGKAVFWVNDTRYQVAVDGTFADFTYLSKTSSDCARVRWGKDGTPTTICPGTVRQFG